jgi:hypothetical protein
LDVRPAQVAAGAPTAFRLDVPPFVVLTDSPLESSHDVVRGLVSLGEQMRATLGLPSSARTIEVYIFDQRGAYDRFIKANYPDLPSRRAYFIAHEAREVVYAFRSEKLDEDLRHEACHALLHAAVGELPLWLDEGLAEYFEMPAEEAGLHGRHLEQLQHGITVGWRPGLTRLENLTDVRRMTAAEYREAWAWVYFLLHAPDLPGPILPCYLADLRRGPAPEPLSARLFRSLRRPDEALIGFLEPLEPAGLPPLVVGATGSGQPHRR